MKIVVGNARGFDIGANRLGVQPISPTTNVCLVRAGFCTFSRRHTCNTLGSLDHCTVYQMYCGHTIFFQCQTTRLGLGGSFRLTHTQFLPHPRDEGIVYRWDQVFSTICTPWSRKNSNFAARMHEQGAASSVEEREARNDQVRRWGGWVRSSSSLCRGERRNDEKEESVRIVGTIRHLPQVAAKVRGVMQLLLGRAIGKSDWEPSSFACQIESRHRPDSHQRRGRPLGSV